MIQIRKLKSADIEKVCALFTEFLPYKRDIDFWFWINKFIGVDDSIAVIAEDKDEKIVGYYAIVPFNLNYMGTILKAGLGLHAFVHPDYRRKVSIFELSNLAYKEAKNKEIKLVYGFPNKNYKDIQLKIERWSEIATFKSIELSAKIKKNNTKFKLKKINNSAKDLLNIEKLIIQNQNINSIELKKTTKYYYERYINHPQKLYNCFYIVVQSKILGFLVLKTFKDEETVKGHIIDFITKEIVTYTDIIDLSLDYFNEEINKLVLWPVNEKFKAEVKKYGNINYGFETFFGLKLIDKSLKDELHNLINFENWNLMMGDSDAF